MANDIYDPDEIVSDSDVFEVLPVGWYAVRVKETKYISAEERAKGCGMRATYVVNGGDFDGRYLFDGFYPQSKPGVQILQKAFKCAGVVKEAMTGAQYEAKLQKLAIAYEGKQLRVKVGHETYKGELSAKVKGYEPVRPTGAVVGVEEDIA